ncbi:MAG: hypothetical protein GF349_04750 [Candidatus Magasanikbacteria bacterium]|nr:hypothetical protein [Candidatus Magasanikbacteria bacterium]
MKKIIKLLTIIFVISGILFPSLGLAKTEPLVLPTNSFIKYEKRPVVYYVASDGRRYEFPNEETFYTWKKDFSNIKKLSYREIRKIKKGKHTITVHPGIKLVKFPKSSKVYAVSSGAELRWISSEKVARDLYGSKWTQEIITLPLEDLENYVFGSDIDNVTEYDKQYQIYHNYFIDRELRNRDKLNPVKTNRKTTITSVNRLPTLSYLREDLRGRLQPGFKPEISSYTLNARYNEEEVTLKPKTRDKNAKILVNDTVIESGMSITLKLNQGENNVKIRVKSGVKSVEYNLRIVRETEDEVDLGLKYIKENLKSSISPEFDPNVRNYQLNAKYSESILKLKAATKDKDAKLYINGNPVRSGKYISLPLKKGENKIRIFVSAGSKNRTYYFTVNRSNFKSLEDAQLKYIRTNLRDDLSPEFSPGRTEYYINATENEDEVRITTSPIDRYADVYIEDRKTKRRVIKLHKGSNIIKIQSYSTEGARMTYYVNILK